MPSNRNERQVADADVVRMGTDGLWLEAEFVNAKRIPGTNFAEDETFLVQLHDDEHRNIQIGRYIVTNEVKNNAGTTVTVGLPKDNHYNYDYTRNVSIYGHGKYAPASAAGFKQDKHPWGTTNRVELHIESVPVRDAIQGAALRSMSNGKVSPEEAKKLEDLRAMVTRYALDDGRFNRAESQEIVNLARTIAPGVEAEAHASRWER